MTWPQIIQLAQFIATAFVAVLMWSWRGFFTLGEHSAKHEHRMQMVEADVVSLKNRMDIAGAETSRLSTCVQGLPFSIHRELMAEYPSMRLSEHLWQENGKAHDDFKGQIKEIRSASTLPSRRSGDQP